MDNNGSITLNEVEVNELMLSIIESSNKIKTIFNKADAQFDRLKSYYSCSSASALINKYEDFSDNFKTIVDNILSYNEDLRTLKKKYVSALDDLTEKLDKDALALLAGGPKIYEEKR